MKVMVRVGQLKWKKYGVPAGGRRRRRIGTCGDGGRKGCFFVNFLNLRQETVCCLERSMGGVGKSGENRN